MILSRWLFAVLLLLFFLSGMAALIYEVLWLKELGLLFGNTSQAMAATLAAFFLGLAVGGEYWGRHASKRPQPLRLYARLEFAVVVCAAGYFALLKLYGWLFPYLFACCSQQAVVFVAVKFVLAVLVLFPPAFFIGGTLPVMSRFVAPDTRGLGRKVAWLYAVNTLGAVAGTVLAGFYLPMWLGYRLSYVLAMATSLLIAGSAYALAGTTTLSGTDVDHSIWRLKRYPELGLFAFLSGLAMLALQVLWGRMFAQVLQNSVYTFALILAVFLVGLALAGWLAQGLMTFRSRPETVLFVMLVAGALLVLFTPFAFLAWTDGLHYIGAASAWPAYLRQIILAASVILGPPVVLLGTVLPLLIRLAEKRERDSGRIVGRLVSLNTAGAITGSLLAGFVLLEQIGLWASIRLIAVVYLLSAGYWLKRLRSAPFGWALLPALGIVLAVSWFDTGKLPAVRVDPVTEDESLLEVWESGAGTVAAIRKGDQTKIKVDNYYTLGGTGSQALEQLQGYLPVLMHEHPRSVYVLGLGTGITAGGVLTLPVASLTVTELNADVIAASAKYFGRYTHGLFFDPRVRVVHEDGRNYLRGTRARYDVIISDLFVPWRAGAGSLYTLDHYRAVWRRLHDDGLFMQWLPAYQLTRADFDVIAKTLLTVFPRVTVWRADFSPLKPVIGLLGQKSPDGLSPNAQLFVRKRQRLLLNYVGDLSAAGRLFELAPLNTDDHPVIEFTAPLNQRSTRSGTARWLAGEDWIELSQRLSEMNSDYLDDVPEALLKLPAAGLHLQRARWLQYQGQLHAAGEEMARYRALLDSGR